MFIGSYSSHSIGDSSKSSSIGSIPNIINQSQQIKYKQTLIFIYHATVNHFQSVELLFVINIILNLTVLMLKKERSSTGVARSKFIDRIKSTAQQQNTHKQNVNLNDIRESSYKLPKSKSNTRHDHSLQRKSPIQINKHTQPGMTSFKNIQQLAEQYGSQTITISNTTKLPTNYTEQHQFDQDQEESYQGNQIARGIKTRKEQLKQQEQALDQIKNIWDNSARLKEKQFFKQEMSEIQKILKQIIIAMAKPKFKFIQQSSSLQSEAPNRFSPFDNLQSLKESKDVSKHVSVDHLRGKGADVSCGSYESEAQQDIEFKKIMYILQQKSKTSKNHGQSQQSSQNDKMQRELKQINHILNQKTSCQSSFNGSSRQLSGYTVRQFEKVSNSRSNDKVFLKNIVKKAKTSASNLQQIKRQRHFNKSRSDLGGHQTKQQAIFEQQPEQQKISQEQIVEQQDEMHLAPRSQYLQKQNEPYYSMNKKHIKIEETLQTLEEDSDSKRAVLNQIIGMLNKKYHKNIKLEPRQF